MAKAFGSQAFQHVISAHSAVRFQQDLQRAAAHGGQALPAFGQLRLGQGQQVIGAAGVIVRGKGQIGLRAAGASQGVVHGAPVLRYTITCALTCYDITQYTA